MADRKQAHKLQGLLVGVNFYRDPLINDLRFAVADAQELHQLLITPPYGFDSEHIDLLLGIDPNTNNASRRNVLVKLSQVARNASEEEMLLFYFSGHSVLIDGNPYLCASDTEVDYIDDTAIPLSRVREIIEASNAPVKVLIFDACHLGARLSAKDIYDNKVFGEKVKNIFRGVRGLAMLASSALEDTSRETEQKKHGIFTYFLLDALMNQNMVDQNSDSHISFTEIFNYVASHLRAYGQQPTIVLEGSGDLPMFHLPLRLSISNPIRRVFPSPVKEPKDFFGRADELRRVQETLLNTSDILVFVHGERCIGKTSFINRVKAMLDEGSGLDVCFLHFSIEPSSIRTVDNFARELWNGLSGVCRVAAPSALVDEKIFSFEGYSQLGFELQDMLRPLSAYRFVVFIDELEKIKKVVDDVTVSQIIGLIRFIIEQTNLPVAFVISSPEDQTRFFPSSFGSPPSNLDVALAPFDRGDCDTMLASFFPSDVTERDKLFGRTYLASGGNPYFAKMLAAEICDASRRIPLENLVADSVWQELQEKGARIPEAVNIFTSLYDHFSDEERYVLLSLVAHTDYIISGQEIARWRVSHRVAARQLEQKYYLIPLADGGYKLRLQLLGEWLKGWQSFSLETERLGLTFANTPAISKEGICVDEGSGKIYLDGLAIETQLSDLQYQALLYLARNPDRVVPRQELYEYLHSKDETYLPTDQSLDALIYRLRLALGDKEQRYLRTVRKRGYLLTQAIVISRN